MPRATQTISNGCRARSSNKKCRYKNIPSRTAACAQDWSVHPRKCRIKSASSRRLASIFYCCNSARNWKKWKYSATASSALAQQNLKRPLALRCGAFGDMVLLTALIRVLHAEFGAPVDIVTSGPWSEPLLRGQPGVGEIFSVRSRKTPFWMSLDQQRVVRQLRARGAGPVWFCDGDDAAMPILQRAGFSQSQIVNVRDHALLPGEHATEQWRRLAQVMPRGAASVSRINLGAI